MWRLRLMESSRNFSHFQCGIFFTITTIVTSLINQSSVTLDFDVICCGFDSDRIINTEAMSLCFNSVPLMMQIYFFIMSACTINKPINTPFDSQQVVSRLYKIYWLVVGRKNPRNENDKRPKKIRVINKDAADTNHNRWFNSTRRILFFVYNPIKVTHLESINLVNAVWLISYSYIGLLVKQRRQHRHLIIFQG